ncbi:MAG: hypothetical protein A3F84_13170 [Candidatus Handelsmanbacteria bacterium RIFCSPLOWO2_12_FULL_64_10]|uniref:DUF4258 domain-containing protein n=1 Tax=Handelsmanbacteria sp. (strain RIFCSPLOWO2_12_FULL_64_10) TaxID=1817868 RepID=A0A1F6D0Q6_HANXR|nr:MAG: hypothetical protein A3F84_13170 [Candidatus Handelsmanbacteria bacterium RIFCSPLOWO2_12_FULL_64_10]
MSEDLAFDALTPLGFRVRCTRAWWEYISTVKHPILKDRRQDVIDTLEHPLEIRRSTKDPAVLLFYREVEPRFLVAVTRQNNGEGFLITAYPADRLKRGEVLWTALK